MEGNRRAATANINKSEQ